LWADLNSLVRHDSWTRSTEGGKDFDCVFDISWGCGPIVYARERQHSLKHLVIIGDGVVQQFFFSVEFSKLQIIQSQFGVKGGPAQWNDSR
jgi:hypothetical protein